MYVPFSEMAAFESVLFRLLGSGIFFGFSESYPSSLVLIETYFCELSFDVL